MKIKLSESFPRPKPNTKASMMYVIEGHTVGSTIFSTFAYSQKDINRFLKIMTNLCKYPPDFSIKVYDISKPCSSTHIDKPFQIYYIRAP